MKGAEICGGKMKTTLKMVKIIAVFFGFYTSLVFAGNSQLNPGWNLVSPPVSEDVPVNEFLDEQKLKVIHIWSWDTELNARSGGWRVYPSEYANRNDFPELSSMKPDGIYWFLTNENSVLKGEANTIKRELLASLPPIVFQPPILTDLHGEQFQIFDLNNDDVKDFIWLTSDGNIEFTLVTQGETLQLGTSQSVTSDADATYFEVIDLNNDDLVDIIWKDAEGNLEYSLQLTDSGSTGSTTTTTTTTTPSSSTTTTTETSSSTTTTEIITTTTTSSSPTSTVPSIQSSSHPNSGYFYNSTSGLFDLSQLSQEETNGFFYFVDPDPAVTFNTTNDWILNESTVSSTNPLITVENLSEGSQYLHAIPTQDNQIQGEADHFLFNVNLSSPQVSSVSHPDQTKAYSLINASLEWDEIPGMIYHYKVDQNPFTIPTASDKSTEISSIAITNLTKPPSGYDYVSNFFHIIARDELGSISPAAHYQINICDNANDKCAPSGMDIVSGVQVSSPTHPDESLWYNNSNPQFTFSGGMDNQYLYYFDTNPITLIQEANHHILSGSELTLPDDNQELKITTKGEHYIHVRGYNDSFLETGVKHFRVNIANTSSFRVSAPALLSGQSVRNLRLYWYHPLMNGQEQTDSFPNYYVLWDQNSDSVPDPETATKTTVNSYLANSVSDGLYFLHIRSEDTEGNLSDTTHFAVSIGEGNDTSQLLTGQGEAIIIAGGGAESNNTLWTATNALAVQTYRTFKARGFTDENIFLFHPDQGIDLDGDGTFETIADDTTPTVNDLKTQIESLKTSEETGPLYLYMVDHGAIDKFQISPSEILSAANLDEWLDNFQTATDRSVVVIIEACHSGSFLDDLEGDNRIIITSTDDDLAFLSHSGDLSYSNFLLQGLFRGLSITAAHERSVQSMSKLGRPYIRMHPQVSQSDIDPIVGGDVFIADFVPEMTSNTPSGTITKDPSSVLGLQAVFSDHYEDMKVWAVITPPDFTPPTTSEDFISPQVFLPKVNLFLTDEINHTYSGSYNILPYRGTYLIQFFAQMPNGEVTVSDTATVLVNDGQVVTTTNDYSANLKTGWNLVGINDSLEGDTVALQIGNLIDFGIESVWEWDSTANNWKLWLSEQTLDEFNDYFGTNFSALPTLNPGKGYWIKMNYATHHDFNGTPYSSTLSLIKGWNLISFGGETRSINQVLSEISESVDSIWSWKGDTWEVYSPKGQVGDFSVLENIDPKKGYWIRIR